jgi:hypothetical protein
VIRWWKRRKLRARPLPAGWAEILARNAPFVASLSAADRPRFEGDLQIFVAERVFLGAGGLEITDEHRVTIGAAAARLTLRLDISAYDQLSEIVVYPGAYKHAGKDDVAILGEAQHWGVVALSWEAVVTGMRNPADGHDTALHELAHAVDAADGGTDGTPPLGVTSSREWARVFSRRFLELRKGKDSKPAMRDYGKTNEAEFFAVASETFFEKPNAMKRKTPDLYEQLRTYYGIDPAAELAKRP